MASQPLGTTDRPTNKRKQTCGTISQCRGVFSFRCLEVPALREVRCETMSVSASRGGGVVGDDSKRGLLDTTTYMHDFHCMSSFIVSHTLRSKS